MNTSTNPVADRLAAALRAILACDSQRIAITNADRAEAREALDEWQAGRKAPPQQPQQ